MGGAWTVTGLSSPSRSFPQSLWRLSSPARRGAWNPCVAAYARWHGPVPLLLQSCGSCAVAKIHGWLEWRRKSEKKESEQVSKPGCSNVHTDHPAVTMQSCDYGACVWLGGGGMGLFLHRTGQTIMPLMWKDVSLSKTGNIFLPELKILWKKDFCSQCVHSFHWSLFKNTFSWFLHCFKSLLHLFE